MWRTSRGWADGVVPARFPGKGATAWRCDGPRSPAPTGLRGGTKLLVALAVLASGLASPRPASGQAAIAGQGPGTATCPADQIEGRLGIFAMQCEGRCSQWRDPEGAWHWRFQTEPRITAVDPDGPSGGVLQRDDVLVAVDGRLITTAEGGDRLANLVPGEMVRVQFRRGREVLERSVEVVGACRRETSAATAPPGWHRSGQWRPAPDAPGSRVPAPGAEAAPRPGQANRPGVPAPPTPTGAESATAISPALPPPPPPGARGGIGFSFSCSRCSSRSEGSALVWDFSEPPLVERVEWGGPAERAGIRAGDRITHLDGVDLTTAEGGRRFGAVQGGDRPRLTVARGDEAFEATVEVRAPGAPAPLSWPAPTIPTPERPEAPRAVVAGELPGPLRYTGTLDDVRVEVRGGPVTVQKDETTGELIIRTYDAVIRLKAPPGGS